MPEVLETIEGIPFWLFKATALILGACFGSFANVVIHRVPKGLSIVRPGSMCPGCGHEIRWYENIPVLSWIFLRARCSGCGNPISIRYPLVELTVAVLSLASLYYGLSLVAGIDVTAAQVGALWFFPFSFVFLLVIITFIDLEHWIIPHVLTITGIVLGIAQSLLIGDLTGVSWLESLIGMAAGAIPIIVIIEVYFRLTGREGMGYGDVMLMAMAGAWLGYTALPFILLASSIQGLIAALVMIAMKKKTTPPWQEGAKDADGNEVPATEAAEPALEAASVSPESTVATESTATTEARPPAEEPAPTDNSTRHLAIPFGPFIALAMMEWLFFSDLISPWIFGF